MHIRKYINPASVLALVALVFAVTGGAYAASGSGSGVGAGGHATASVAKAKKKSSSKGVAGPRGPAGPAGPAGVQGSAGPAGAKGENGSNGSNGSNGESVTAAEVKVGESLCSKLGGAKFTVGGKETTACNGKEGKTGAQGPQGEPWTDGGTLPEGASEKGVWTFAYNKETAEFSGAYPFISISFMIPLSTSPIAVVEVPLSESGIAGSVAHCPGTAAAPAAEAGYVCLYVRYSTGGSGSEIKVVPYEAFTGTTGTTQFLEQEGGLKAGALEFGTWAVTATS